MKWWRRFWAMVALLFSMAGCNLGVAEVVIVTLTPVPTFTPTASSTATFTPTPTETLTVTATFIPVVTETLTPSKEPVAQAIVWATQTPLPLIPPPPTTAFIPTSAPVVVVPPSPFPTDTPIPFDGEVLEVGDGLRLRVAPGLSAEVVMPLPAKTPLRFIGRTGDGGWIEVMTAEGQAGWVWGAYLRVFTDTNALPITGETLLPPTVPAPNGVSVVSGVSSNARQIFERGQALGNRRDVFSKVGDSLTVATYVLYPFSWGRYDLGEYQHLQDVINFFSATTARQGNSFANISLTADNGWTTRDILNPSRAESSLCLAGETPLACEYRVVKPAVALILIGTNDVASVPIDEYRTNLQRIIQISVEQGVIPVVSTIPNRLGFDVSPYNQAIVSLATANAIPLWDYGRAMQGLPNNGLSADGVHPSFPSESDYALSAYFTGGNLAYGYVMRNLTALEVLDMLWRQVLSY